MAYVASRGSVPQPTPGAAKATVASRTPVSEPVARESGRTQIVQMDRMRQIIAEHMVRSKATSAHVTSFAEIDVSALVKLREARKAAFLEREGVKLTYTPFFVHAAVEALKDHPLLNASVDGKQIHMHRDFHIGIAVAIGKSGLVAPVMRYAGQKNVAGLAHSAADLATRARSKKLQPDELQGGTFTVTNVGSLGSIMGTPIINQPQVAILATGAITKRPVVLEDPELGDVIAVRSMMYVSLSYDHRIIDGAMAASFLNRYREVLEAYSPSDEV
jgi:2-oxoglutarate dehydrogenase E2 component (dihydrolipoamide succinyltransferase)